MTSATRALKWLALTALCAVPLAGCHPATTTGGSGTEGPKFSKANFDKIRVGMTMDQVNELLGFDDLVTAAWNIPRTTTVSYHALPDDGIVPSARVVVAYSPDRRVLPAGGELPKFVEALPRHKVVGRVRECGQRHVATLLCRP